MLCDVMILLLSHQVVSNSFAIPWTVAHQAPLSMGFPRQEYWSALPFPSPRDLLDPEVEYLLLGRWIFFTTELPGMPIIIIIPIIKHRV